MSDYETTQHRRNVIVGVFVLVALCALVYLIFKFGDLPGFISKRSSFNVVVKFPSATGIQRDTPVRFCGYEIGKVWKVMPPERLKDDLTGLFYHQTKVAISIDKRYVNIPSNVDVKVMTRGLGSSSIELKIDPARAEKPLDPNRPEETLYLVEGMMLQGSAGMTSEFFPEESQKKLDELANNIIELINNANEILGDKENKENLKSALANLSDSADNAKHAIKEFEKFMVSSTETSEQLSKTVSELRIVLEKINNGSGTVAKLVNDGRLYESLLENTEQLDILIKSIKEFVEEYRAKGIKIKL